MAREAAVAAERVATEAMDVREFMHRLLEEGEIAHWSHSKSLRRVAFGAGANGLFITDAP